MGGCDYARSPSSNTTAHLHVAARQECSCCIVTIFDAIHTKRGV